MGHGGYRPGAGSGGKRPGAGRRRGSRGKRQLAMTAAMNQIQASLGPNAGPLELLLAVMRDERFDARTRVEAAVIAAPYFHRRQRRARQTAPVTTAAPIKLTITPSGGRSMKAKLRKCTCKAYPFPHRASGGLCRYPDPPLETFDGKAGKHAPVGMRPGSAIRRRLMKKYALHPIRDRASIRRWLPKLYVAYCRRHGYPYPEWWFGGYVPAMRVTADGPRAASAPT